MTTDPEAPSLEEHRRPDGVTDDTVRALGKLSEAVEWIERARGRLDFHQMSGHADLLVGEELDLRRWRRRSWWQRTTEGVSELFAPWM